MLPNMMGTDLPPPSPEKEGDGIGEAAAASAAAPIEMAIDETAVEMSLDEKAIDAAIVKSGIKPIVKAGSGGDTGGNGSDSPPPPREGPSDFAVKHNIHVASLEDQANPLSQWLLSFMAPLLKIGGSRTLDPEDMGVPSKADMAGPAYELSHKLWGLEMERVSGLNDAARAKYDTRMERKSKGNALKREEMEKKSPFRPVDPSVSRILVRGFGRGKIAFAMVMYILSSLLAFGPVMLLEDLVKYFESGLSASEYGGLANPWVEVAALGALPVIISILQTRSQVLFLHLAVYVRTAVSTLLYEKSLSVSAAGRAATSTGQVVNMMSNDTQQLQRFIQFGGMTLTSPIQIVLALVLIYRQVGNATWVGVAFMVALAPVNVMVFSIVGKQRRQVLRYSDLRVKMMNEILNGIRIIKYYAWEKAFGAEVGKVRESELRALTKLAYTSAIGFSLILLSAPIIQPILVFLTFMRIQTGPLSAAKAFTTVALFNIMRFPFAFLPMGMLQFIQSQISLKRLSRYLRLPELEKYIVDGPHPDDASGMEVGSISMRECSFAWVSADGTVEPLEDRKPKKKRGSKSGGSSVGGSVNGDSDDDSSRGSVKKRKSLFRRKKRDDEMISTNHSVKSYISDIETKAVDPITLKDLTCTIEAGSLVAVVGEVGSGKSSFLSAILGEMEPLTGSNVYIPRGLHVDSQKEEVSLSNFSSYCSQTPWVVNDTLKGNVLFGRPFDQRRYDEIVTACALRDDLAVLPAGDMTEIGERGINLSGGQKARVSLARALYSESARLLLLDDPLSAVDAHVGEHLFREAITGAVSEGTTRILVTHHVHFLPQCDRVIVLEEGRIKHMGTYAELVESGVNFAGAVDVTRVESVDDSKDGNDEKEEKDSTITKVKEKGGDDDGGVKGKMSDEAAPADKKGDDGGVTAVEHTTDAKKKGENLTTKEEREEGSIGGAQYIHYARAGGMFTFISLFVVQGLGRASEIGANFWLAYWANSSIMAAMKDVPLNRDETTWYLNIYAAFGILGVLCLTIRSIFMAIHRLHASRQLHERLVSSVLRAPVSFFDVTPIGRVLNRFAADMDKIDLDLTQSLGQGGNTIFQVLGAVGAIVAATKGTFIILLIPMSYLYYIIQKWFRKTSTELQRVTNISASPIFSDFSQVLSGTSTIRAYGEKERFFSQCQKSFDRFNAAYNLSQMCNFWLGLRLDMLGGLIGAFIGAVALGTLDSGFIPAGWLGLALSYAIEVTTYLKHGVRMIAQVEADMSSVERILDYTENIEAEAPMVVPDKDPKGGTWPMNGKIDIDSVSMRYRDGPLVLKDISLTIRGGEKIGVVGRTGSGKSSLMNLLFRITEPEKDGGRVLIDDVNTSQIGTEVLRLNLSIIPQDPIMFSNTVRYNLDPFETSTDEQLWEVLKKVRLAEVIASLPELLEDQVAEGGENFSQGQRQLLCIARSLLRDPKILVMDEATASIDNATDAAIQQMIRENFRDATVLTIAHRLGTIMDSDRVLVLDDGKIAEFDTPAALLVKEGGLFRGMVEKSQKVHKIDEGE